MKLQIVLLFSSLVAVTSVSCNRKDNGSSVKKDDYRYLSGTCYITGTEQDILSSPKALPKNVSFTLTATSDPKDDFVDGVFRYPKLIEESRKANVSNFDPSNKFLTSNFNKDASPKNRFGLFTMLMSGETWDPGRYVYGFLLYKIIIKSLPELQALLSALGKELSVDTIKLLTISYHWDHRHYFQFDDKNKDKHFDEGETIEFVMSSNSWGTLQLHLPKEIENGLSLHFTPSCKEGQYWGR